MIFIFLNFIFQFFNYLFHFFYGPLKSLFFLVTFLRSFSQSLYCLNRFFVGNFQIINNSDVLVMDPLKFLNLFNSMQLIMQVLDLLSLLKDDSIFLSQILVKINYCLLQIGYFLIELLDDHLCLIEFLTTLLQSVGVVLIKVVIF